MKNVGVVDMTRKGNPKKKMIYFGLGGLGAALLLIVPILFVVFSK